jgi:hypothetical protein
MNGVERALITVLVCCGLVAAVSFTALSVRMALDMWRQ